MSGFLPDIGQPILSSPTPLSPSPSPSTQRRNARRREEFLKRSSTLSHLHHLNLKDNFSSDIANSFFMDVLSPFWGGRWLPPTQYLYYVKFGAKDSGQRLFRGGGASLRRGRKRVAPPQSDGKNRFLLTRLVFCQIIHLFEWNISHFPPPHPKRVEQVFTNFSPFLSPNSMILQNRHQVLWLIFWLNYCLICHKFHHNLYQHIQWLPKIITEFGEKFSTIFPAIPGLNKTKLG